MTDITSYEQTIRDLELRIAKSQEELSKLEQALAILRSIVATGRASEPTESPVISGDGEVESPSRRFSDMSVRWAVLKCLADSVMPMKTADIATALNAGGSVNGSRANVSAVISDMVNKRNELSQEGDGYSLTETGQAVWSSIKRSARYADRHFHTSLASDS